MTRRNTMLRPLPTLTLVLTLLARLPAENVITLGYGEGSQGATGVQVMVTATNDAAIHGYSLAFTYPAEALRCTEIATAGTHVALLGPEFVAQNFNDQLGVGVLGVIFDFTDPISAPAKELSPSAAGDYPRIIARITFSVRPDAPGGVYPLELKDGIGTPASFNRFTSRGTSIKPRLVNGSFRVFGGNVLTLEKKFAIAGATPSLGVFASVQHPDPLAGFQIAFTYEKAALTLPDLDAGTQGIQNANYTTTSLGFELGNKVELFNFDVDLNFSPILARAACAVLFDYVQPYDGQVLSPATGSPPTQSVMKFTFRVEAAADDQKQWQDLHLDNTLIPGAVDNRFIIGDRGVDPSLSDGKVYFSQGNLVGTIIDRDTQGGLGGAKVMTDPDGFEAVTAPGGGFRFDGIPPGKYTLLVSKVTNPATYYQVRHFKTESGAEIVVDGNGIDSSAGRLPIYPIPVGGPIMRKPFIRGHVNPDSKVDLSDAVSILLYLFRGGEEPGCLLAVDVNDDNKADISDAVYMLNYLFVGGPKPPAPFSLTATGCTDDPTPGGKLSCNESSCL